MAELVYQTWERITGRPWSEAAAGGFTTGSYADNIALQQRLLGGWNPFAAAGKPKAKKPSKGKPKIGGKKGKISGPQAVSVQPGLQHQQFLLGIGLQEMIAQLQAELQREGQADVRRLQEAQLGANPADFVAYELYKRSLVEQGFEPTGDVRTDEEIQELFELALGQEGTRRETLGAGQFGVDIPTTGSISRSELQGYSPTDIDILSSFLRGGVETDGDFQGINPEDYFTELEEGLIPTLPTQRTQYVV